MASTSLQGSIAARFPGWTETMEPMITDMGPLLQLKREVLAFYKGLANKRQNVRAESGGEEVYNPSVQELRIHLHAHVLVMERLLGSNLDLVSAYHLCDKHLKTIMEAFEAEKANQQQLVQHPANNPTVTVDQSRLFRSGQDVDLHGRPLPIGLRHPVRARSPFVEDMESPAKKAKTKSRLVTVGTEIMQERMYSRASHGLPGPWQAEETPNHGHHLFPE